MSTVTKSIHHSKEIHDIWSRLCKDRRLRIGDRLNQLLVADKEFLSRLQEYTPGMEIIPAQRAKLGYRVDSADYEAWAKQITRLKMDIGGRVSKLMLEDIIELQKVPTVFYEVDGYVRIAPELPLDTMEKWHQLCDQMGITYFHRLTRLMEADIKHLEKMKAHQPATITEPKKKYFLQIINKVYIPWQMQCKRLEVSAAQRIAELIKQDIMHLKKCV